MNKINIPKISIIVPVYNVEKYIHQCIDSILGQTFTDFELLLINDGSPDNCGAICDDYVAKDPRVRVFHQENSGVSAARNRGLDEARGEWVSFVDSDDYYLSNSVIAELIGLIGFNKIEMLVFEYSSNKCNQSSNLNISSNIVSKSLISYFKYIDNRFYSWRFWIKRFILIENQTQFDVNYKMHEDCLFIFQAIMNVNTLLYVDKCVVMYRQHDESVMHINDVRYIYDTLNVSKSMMGYSKCFIDLDAEFFFSFIQNRIYSSLRKACLPENLYSLPKIRSYIIDNFPVMYYVNSYHLTLYALKNVIIYMVRYPFRKIGFSKKNNI